ncbi:hypothetical protein EMEDMD4_300116 [Sinorhizobium medicae]|uniref:Uncharacterized protein n=1 Tax=Sinorhizobium medicae TaxID=110321 RepID=A0A508WY67_9HYPH|nr:hypothetical protein EMEDMD4_300116 [Sinorhizobium medicae]
MPRVPRNSSIRRRLIYVGHYVVDIDGEGWRCCETNALPKFSWANLELSHKSTESFFQERRRIPARAVEDDGDVPFILAGLLNGRKQDPLTKFFAGCWAVRTVATSGCF